MADLMAEQTQQQSHTRFELSCPPTTTTPDPTFEPREPVYEIRCSQIYQEKQHFKDNTLRSRAEEAPSVTESLEQGKQRQAKTEDEIATALDTVFHLTSPVSNRRRTPRHNKTAHAPILISSSIESNMSSSRLFIASLGNPPPYASTRHSAGHILIKALQTQLQFPMFQKSKAYANGLTSSGMDIGRPDFTLWQSPVLMNISGVALLKAYKTFMSTAQASATDPLPGLVVLYDEMETSPSQLRLRPGATSAKGHNGLKSVQQTFQSAGLLSKLGDRFVKIGVGIGRPAGGSRTSEDVSNYVLGQLTGSEKQAIDGKADALIKMLEAEASRMSS